ncbi:hypothetical protein C8R47DRAFT_1320707 [Mycena vitilis]|nr:hypothetical protein C8R47DRAFT_1320707 [Mycena vitilis]
MPSSVPPELTDRIIDFLWESQPDLRTCSTVCWRWLPSTRYHLFRIITVRADSRFLTLLQSPSKVVQNHAQALDLRLWPLEVDMLASHIPSHLPALSVLRTMIIGSFSPCPGSFPLLCGVTKLSFHHTKFAACADFTCFLSKFPGLRELELKWVTWADARDDVSPRIFLDLEMFSIQGFKENPDILRWLSSPHFAPCTRGLSLYLPTNIDSTALHILSKFLRNNNCHLEYLQLDAYPSPDLQHIIGLLQLKNLTSLNRLRIGHGVYFHSSSTPGTPSTLRIFPVVLDVALRLTSGNQLTELILDVNISVVPWPSTSDSDSFLNLNRFLADPGLAKISTVRFHVIRGGASGTCATTVVAQRQLFVSLMRERELLVGEKFIISDESREGPVPGTRF